MTTMASPTRRQPATLLLAVLLTAPFLASADATIANVATPAIRTGLHTTGSAAQFVVGSYFITFAVLLITGARLGQTHGYKRLFLTGVALFGITSLGDGLAPNVTILIAMRALQGVAAAMALPQVLTSIQLRFDGERRARAVGMYAIALSAGAVVGQVLGGALITADIAGASWRPIFLINVPLCIAVLVGGSRVLPGDDRHGRSRIDLPGVTTLSASVLAVVVPLTFGPTLGWPAWTWIVLAVSAPAFALFLVIERRARSAMRAPLIDTSILARPAIGWALVGLLGSSATYFALLFTLAQYLQIGLGHSALFSGLILVPWVAAFGFAGPARRYLPAPLVPKLPVAGFLLLAGVYLTIGATALTGHLSTPLLAVLFVPGGFGLGIVFTALLGHLASASSRQHAPDISGISSTTSQIAGSIGVAGFGALYLAVAGHHSPGHAFGITALAFGATAVLATIPTHLATKRRAPAEPDSPGSSDYLVISGQSGSW